MRRPYPVTQADRSWAFTSSRRMWGIEYLALERIRRSLAKARETT